MCVCNTLAQRSPQTHPLLTALTDYKDADIVRMLDHKIDELPATLEVWWTRIIESNSTHAVYYMLERGIDFDEETAYDEEEKMSPVRLAIRKGQPEMVEAFVNCGADILQVLCMHTTVYLSERARYTYVCC